MFVHVSCYQWCGHSEHLALTGKTAVSRAFQSMSQQVKCRSSDLGMMGHAWRGGLSLENSEIWLFQRPFFLPEDHHILPPLRVDDISEPLQLLRSVFSTMTASNVPIKRWR